MATKKAETKPAETEEVKAKAKVEDDGMEEILIPIDYSNPDEMTQYISVNGVAILVPKGEKVKVKREYAQAWAIRKAMIDAKFEKAARDRASGDSQGYINTTY